MLKNAAVLKAVLKVKITVLKVNFHSDFCAEAIKSGFLLRAEEAAF